MSSSLLSLWLLTFAVFRQGRSQDVLSSCPTEAILCYADEDCAICADQLQTLADSSGVSVNATDCQTFFGDICTAVDTDECDVENELLLDFAQCVSEEEFNCTGFTSCADVVVSTLTPAGTPTVSPTAMPTMSHTSVAPTAVPTMSNTTVAPTPVSQDVTSVAPTEVSPTEAESESSAGVRVSSTTTIATTVALLLSSALLAVSVAEQACAL